MSFDITAYIAAAKAAGVKTADEAMANLDAHIKNCAADFAAAICLTNDQSAAFAFKKANERAAELRSHRCALVDYLMETGGKL